jgi:hypothetical protein
LDVLKRRVRAKGDIRRTDLDKEKSTAMTTRNLTTSLKLSPILKKTLRL